jgi:ABC-2 type transport system permease protein
MLATATAPAADHYRLRDVMGSEWIKLTSTRSYRRTLLAFAVVTIGIGIAVSAATGANWAHHDHHGFDPTNQSLAGLAFGELAMGVLGVLAITSEYSSGAIRSTLAAVPHRRLVLAAKAAVSGLVALVVGEAVTFATWFAGQQAMGRAPHASLSQPGVARAVLLSGAYLALIGLFGLGLGAIVRNSAAGIGLFVGIVLALPFVLLAFGDRAIAFSPEGILSNSVAAVVPAAHALSAWAGFGMMALYAAVALVLGLIVLTRRDA